MTSQAIAALLLSLTSALPNRVLTPGAVTTATAAQLCRPGATTKRMRPPAAYTTKLKIAQMHAAKLPGHPRDYEEDHLIALELGGDPRSPLNLWPQRWTGRCNAHDKDQLENTLHRLVCDGALDLVEAQRAIAVDWTAAYRRFLGPLACE